MKINTEDLQMLNKKFQGASPDEILMWCSENLSGNLAMMTSFQISGMVILHKMHKLFPELPVYFIDTGYHFPETLEFRDKIIQEFNFNIQTVSSKIPHEEFEKKYGPELYNSNPDLCCQINKIEPQERVMNEAGYHHWISGIRKDQGPSRASHKVFMTDSKGMIRIHPLINWKWDDVWNYLHKNEVPYHSLYKFGYPSIGCAPNVCTTPGNFAGGERSGRWQNSTKTECGLHLQLSSGVNTDISQTS
ncbi:MAG: phosphoadenylyl-sulfate reductase [Bacteroidales bacterium]|nr:phosphoadenylyl-sulfate reductase [Bacteroidales bacterium]MCF8456896.1 phosphoadenylyl-sulfate reductase [Bacteroidales bacterium]